jgi:hypothetical protein
MKTTCFLVCLSMTLAMGNSYAAQAPTPVAQQGETRVVSIFGKVRVQAKIKTHEMQIGKPSDGRPAVIQSNCTYSRYPCSIVDRIDITVNGKSLFVPRSAFCDLADVSEAQIHVDDQEFVLRLDGGDASEGYIATVEFDAQRVKRRTVSSGTLPDHPLQETVYNVVVEGE